MNVETTSWPQKQHILTPLLRKNDATKRIAPKTLYIIKLPHWSAEQLPFFCRIEHQWGKKMSVPVKFRLGSVDYVDWLEGK